jgi:hypothetical protein
MARRDSDVDRSPHTDVANDEEGAPTHVERGGEVRADNDQKWSDDETARQERGLPEQPADRREKRVSSRTTGKAEG